MRSHPRLHVEVLADAYRVAHESGLAVTTGQPTREFPGLSMFFGGVGAVSWSPANGFAAAADPRQGLALPKANTEPRWPTIQ